MQLQPKLRNQDKAEEFINSIDLLRISEIELHIDSDIDGDRVTPDDINGIVNCIESVFLKQTSAITFGCKNDKVDEYTNFKPWFNRTCIQARNIYHDTRKMYNKYKTIRIRHSIWRVRTAKMQTNRSPCMSQFANSNGNIQEVHIHIIRTGRRGLSNSEGLNRYAQFALGMCE